MSRTDAEDAFLELEFPVEVWLASEEVPLGRLLDLKPGDVFSLDKHPEARVDLVVNGTRVASGDLVVMEGRFGFRVAAMASQGLADVEQDADIEKERRETLTDLDRRVSEPKEQQADSVDVEPDAGDEGEQKDAPPAAVATTAGESANED